MVEPPLHDLKSGHVRAVEHAQKFSASTAPLGRWLDPEWLPFEAFLLLPALACALWGDVDRAVFYSRLALEVGCLKWMGWAVLTRVSEHQLQFLRFPAELIIGLAMAV